MNHSQIILQVDKLHIINNIINKHTRKKKSLSRLIFHFNRKFLPFGKFSNQIGVIRKWIAQETRVSQCLRISYDIHMKIKSFFPFQWTKFQFIRFFTSFFTKCTHNLIICFRCVNICSIWFEPCHFKLTTEFLDI